MRLDLIWDAREEKWDIMLKGAYTIKQREGHCNVSIKYIEIMDGGVTLKLGGWWSQQRYRYNKRSELLDAQKEKRLESLDVKWNIPRREPRIIRLTTPAGGMILNLPRPSPRPSRTSLWESNFLLLLKFRDREGHLRVPARHVEDNQQLGTWISRNRTHKRLGTLVPEEERRLNEIGFLWDGWDGHFDLMITALTQFKQREGHCNISIKHIELLDHGGVKLKLGRWLKKERCKQRSKSLDAKKEKRLESLGVTWNNKNHAFADGQFDRNFDLLLAFQEREGHVRVPIKHQESGKDNLGNWLKEQRSRYRRGLLELDRQKWLETAGVTWEKRIGS